MKFFLPVVACSALFATAAIAPASAGCYYGHGCGYGAATALGIIGGLSLGAAMAPQPQPNVIVVQPAPQPAYVSPPPEYRRWWCRTSERWYPDVETCPVPWSR